MSVLSRRLAGAFDAPAAPAPARNVASLDVQLAALTQERDALHKRLADLDDERAGNDVARAMLRERAERIGELEAQVAQLTLERDALKQAVDDLTAPVEEKPARKRG